MGMYTLCIRPSSVRKDVGSVDYRGDKISRASIAETLPPRGGCVAAASGVRIGQEKDKHGRRVVDRFRMAPRLSCM